jgi:hypothetical protein
LLVGVDFVVEQREDGSKMVSCEGMGFNSAKK